MSLPASRDIYSALPAITGKIELEYEGELKGADTIARDLIRQAVQMIFRQYYPTTDFKQVIDWFEMGGNLKFSDTEAAASLSAGWSMCRDCWTKPKRSARRRKAL